MKRIDSHAHLTDEAFDVDRDEVLARIQEDMEFVVNIGFDLESSLKCLDYAKKYPFLYAVVGLHPAEEEEYTEELEAKFEALAKEEKVLAIGEIGLDYHWMTKEKDVQKEIFRKQMALAERCGLPVVIHSRDAMHDTVEILKEFPKVKGILHCYPGSVETAREIIDSYYLGIGGALTFKNARKLLDVVREIPLEHLILETDCPYMAPVPHRGKRNEPNYTEEVARKIAELKGITYEEVVEATNINTKKAYGLL